MFSWGFRAKTSAERSRRTARDLRESSPRNTQPKLRSLTTPHAQTQCVACPRAETLQRRHASDAISDKKFWEQSGGLPIRGWEVRIDPDAFSDSTEALIAVRFAAAGAFAGSQFARLSSAGNALMASAAEADDPAATSAFASFAAAPGRNGPRRELEPLLLHVVGCSPPCRDRNREPRSAIFSCARPRRRCFGQESLGNQRNPTKEEAWRVSKRRSISTSR
jgi:hypothetical protein